MVANRKQRGVNMSKNETLEEKKARLSTIHDEANAHWAELKQKLPPGYAINSFEGRMTRFVAYLVEIGVLTEFQLTDFEIKFMEEVNATMTRLEKEVKEHEKEIKLHVPPSGADKKLILPGGGN